MSAQRRALATIVRRRFNVRSLSITWLASYLDRDKVEIASQRNRGRLGERLRGRGIRGGGARDLEDVRLRRDDVGRDDGSLRYRGAHGTADSTADSTTDSTTDVTTDCAADFKTD